MSRATCTKQCRWAIVLSRSVLPQKCVFWQCDIDHSEWSMLPLTPWRVIPSHSSPRVYRTDHLIPQHVVCSPSHRSSHRSSHCRRQHGHAYFHSSRTVNNYIKPTRLLSSLNFCPSVASACNHSRTCCHCSIIINSTSETTINSRHPDESPPQSNPFRPNRIRHHSYSRCFPSLPPRTCEIRSIIFRSLVSHCTTFRPFPVDPSSLVITPHPSYSSNPT